MIKKIIPLSFFMSMTVAGINLVHAYSGVPFQAPDMGTTVVEWGTVDPNCVSEGSSCADDPAFTPAKGGYRAGGSVSWSFDFDASKFSSLSSIQLEVVAVGLYQAYPGNIDPSQGQIGNYLAIDGVPFAPFLNLTDGRDTRVFNIPTLSAGPHTFAVVAYDNPPGPNYEGWAGVDYAKLTLSGVPIQTYPLTLTFAGTGGGSVSGDISCISGASCPSSAFDLGSTVNLVPLADGASLFTGWSGACTNTSGNCSLTMDSGKAVTATFMAAPRAKVAANEFSSLQEAYSDAATTTGSVIKLLEGIQTENVTIDRNISVFLQGGYLASYSGIGSETSLKGTLLLRSGAVRVNGVNVN